MEQKPKIKVKWFGSGKSTSKHNYTSTRATSDARKNLFGLFKFIIGYDKRKKF